MAKTLKCLLKKSDTYLIYQIANLQPALKNCICNYVLSFEVCL